MIRLYSMIDSGNCYKPRLAMHHLGIAFEHVEVNSVDGTTRSDAYLKLNPAGKVPFLRLEDGRTLSESNAMLSYLADGSPLIPQDLYDRAQMFEWMFFEQYSHEPNIAVRRSITLYPERAGEADPAAMRRLLEGGNRALEHMERRLSKADWLAGDAFSIADIALYAYTHVADQAGFDLATYPGIQNWLERIANLPDHVPLEWLPDRAVRFGEEQK
jgi:glutathione S-transferase